MKPDDYYQILGVSKTATREEIQKAHRQLVRKYHPDLNPNDPKGREKFQKVQEAFDVLGNAEKRKVYDQFGVSPDQMGSGGGQGPFQWSFGGGAPGGQFRKGNFNVENIEDLMKMFGGGFGGAASDEFINAGRRPVKGQDIELSLAIPFTQSITGGKIDIRHPDGQTVSVTIPPGITDEKKIRVPGLGQNGQNGGKAGNLILLVHVDAHPFYHRQGDNLYVELPLSLKEAVFGTKIDVPTPKGNVTLTVPAGATSGMKLRIKQCGIPDKTGKYGDLFAKLLVILPKNWSEEDKKHLEQLRTETEEPIRNKLRWE